MYSFRRKVESKVKNSQGRVTNRQDLWSAQEFKKGLIKGGHSIGSLLFSGDDREVKIVKQLCSYLGYTYVKRQDVLCKHPEATNTFRVVHYIVM